MPLNAIRARDTTGRGILESGMGVAVGSFVVEEGDLDCDCG